jgi:hypothetical protein
MHPPAAKSNNPVLLYFSREVLIVSSDPGRTNARYVLPGMNVCFGKDDVELYYNAVIFYYFMLGEQTMHYTKRNGFDHPTKGLMIPAD